MEVFYFVTSGLLVENNFNGEIPTHYNRSISRYLFVGSLLIEINLGLARILPDPDTVFHVT